MDTLKSMLVRSEEITALLQNLDGELDAETETELAEISSALPEKIQKYFNLIEMLNSNADHFKRQKSFYANAEKSCSNLINNIKSRLKSRMVEHGIDALEGLDVRFKLSNAKAAIQIDETKLDKKYKTVVVSEVVNTELINADLKSGKSIFGVVEIPSYSLRTYAKRK